MAEVCMENYDPEFTKLTKPGDVFVTGFNFGVVSDFVYFYTHHYPDQDPRE